MQDNYKPISEDNLTRLKSLVNTFNKQISASEVDLVNNIKNFDYNEAITHALPGEQISKAIFYSIASPYISDRMQKDINAIEKASAVGKDLSTIESPPPELNISKIAPIFAHEAMFSEIKLSSNEAIKAIVDMASTLGDVKVGEYGNIVTYHNGPSETISEVESIIEQLDFKDINDVMLSKAQQYLDEHVTNIEITDSAEGPIVSFDFDGVHMSALVSEAMEMHQ